MRGADVRRFLQQEFGLIRSLAAVYGLLHRLGYYRDDLLRRLCPKTCSAMFSAKRKRLAIQTLAGALEKVGYSLHIAPLSDPV